MLDWVHRPVFPKDSLRSEHKTSRSESSSAKADVSAKSDSVKIKGLQANVTIPKVALHQETLPGSVMRDVRVPLS